MQLTTETPTPRSAPPRTIRHPVEAIENSLGTGRFQRTLALVAAGSGVLSALEVSMEHYRGSYGQKVMYSPVALSLGLAGASALGTVNSKAARRIMPLMSWLLIADGVIGFGYHVRGIARKPGGWRLPVTNIVMGPPIFAPLLLTIGGFLGVVASKLEPEESVARASLSPQALRRLLATATIISGVLNGFEALYSHYKSNFQYKAQWIPIALTPPIVLGGFAGLASRRLAKWVLAPVSAVGMGAGLIGAYYHVRGITRRDGFKQRPLYHAVYGPPPFAPLLFAATGFLGLLAAVVDPKPKRGALR